MYLTTPELCKKLSKKRKKELEEKIKNYNPLDKYREEPFFEEMLEKLIQDKEELIIDWNYFEELYERRNDEMYNAAVHQLEELNLLTVTSKGNYFLMGCGVCLNPRHHIFELYFTRKQDVEAYKEARYKNAQYCVSISRMEK